MEHAQNKAKSENLLSNTKEKLQDIRAIAKQELRELQKKYRKDTLTRIRREG